MDAPNPGSREAIAKGCTCPVIDNGHGRGYMGGVKDKDGNTLFVYAAGCPVHKMEVVMDYPMARKMTPAMIRADRIRAAISAWENHND